MSRFDTVPDRSQPSPVYGYRVPSPPLSDFIAVYWYADGHEPSGAVERLLPTGAADLVIRLGCSGSSNSVLSGPQSQARVIATRAMRDPLLGVHFRPGGLFPFLGCPSSDLHGRAASLDAVWGERSAGRLLASLDAASSVEARFCVLDRWFRLRLASAGKFHPAVGYALGMFAHGVRTSSRELAAGAGFSQRRFSELFRDWVGMGPKRFSRLQRFQRTLCEARRWIGANSDGGIDWTGLAAKGEYADQSHMIHEFREFGGFAPGRYAELRTQHDNHLRAAG